MSSIKNIPTISITIIITLPLNKQEFVVSNFFTSSFSILFTGILTSLFCVRFLMRSDNVQINVSSYNLYEPFLITNEVSFIEIVKSASSL